MALFSWQKLWFLATVALSFLFDKHYPIRVTRLKRFISQITDKPCNYFLFLSIFNAPCMRSKFDVTGNLENFYELNKTYVSKHGYICHDFNFAATTLVKEPKELYSLRP